MKTREETKIICETISNTIVKYNLHHQFKIDDTINVKLINENILNKSYNDLTIYKNHFLHFNNSLYKNNYLLIENIQFDIIYSLLNNALKAKYNLNDWQIHKQYKNHKIYFVIIIANLNDNIISNINEDLAKFGYFLGGFMIDIDKQNRQWKYLQYEPYEQDDESKEIKHIYKYAYHISPIENHKNIKSKGLIPNKSNNEVAMHPKRLYLYCGTSEDELKQLIRELSENNIYKNNKSKLFTIYRITLDDIPNDIKLYYDVNTNNGIFVNEILNYNLINDLRIFDIKKDRFIELNFIQKLKYNI